MKVLIFLFLFSCTSFGVLAQDISYYRDLATRGDASSRAVLAQMHLLGESTNPDGVEARKLASAALVGDSLLARWVMAECLKIGYGITRDFRQAEEMYQSMVGGLKEFAESKPRIAYALSTMYEFGNGVSVRVDSAEHYLKGAANAGLAPAEHKLGLQLLQEAKTRIDSGAALNMIQSASDKGFVPSMFFLASYQIRYESTAQRAFQLMKKAAEMNYVPAQHAVAGYYYGGLGTAKDTVESLRWYKISAEQRYAPSCAELGFRYKLGAGVAKDNSMSVVWFLCSIAFAQDYRTELLNVVKPALQQTIGELQLAQRKSAVQEALSKINQMQSFAKVTPSEFTTFLRSDSRRVWRLVSFLDTMQKKQEFSLAFARNQQARVVQQTTTEDLFTTDYVFEVNEDSQQLVLKGDSSTQKYSVIVCTPGLLCISGNNSKTIDGIQIFESLSWAESKKVRGLNGVNPFGEARVKYKSAEQLPDKSVKCTFSVKNVPEQGMSISLAGYALDEDSKEYDKEIQSEFCKKSNETIYVDGDYEIIWNVEKQLALNKTYSSCVLYASADWNADGKFTHLLLRYPAISIDLKKQRR